MDPLFFSFSQLIIIIVIVTILISNEWFRSLLSIIIIYKQNPTVIANKVNQEENECDKLNNYCTTCVHILNLAFHCSANTKKTEKKRNIDF